MTLAATADDPGMRELDGWKDLAIDSILDLNLPCAKYAKVLLDFVDNYGGGEGAPLITFMDSVAKKFGCNVTLGQSFWDGLTNVAFSHKLKFFPLTRVSLALTNLTGDKVEDGVARLLNRGDISKVAGKPKQDEANTAEQILGEAMQIAVSLGGYDEVMEPLGQLFVRVGLRLTGKEKMGREKTVYKRGDICKSFLEDVSQAKGRPIKFDEWDRHDVTGKPEASEKGKRGSTPAPTMATLNDHTNPTWLAQKAGFAVGAFVVQKGVDVSAQRLYTIFSIGKTVQLHQVCSYSAEPHKAEIDLTDLVSKWSVTKLEPPRQMECDQTRPQQLYVDKQKAALFRALLELDAKHFTKQKMMFWKSPDEVRTAGPVKQGHLTLVPVAPLLNISSKNTSSGSGIALGDYKVGDTTMPFFVIPVPTPKHKNDNPTMFEDDTLVAAYWWVGTTSDKKQANMTTSHVSHGGYMLPVLTNSVDLESNTKLVMLVKPKPKAVPIADAEAAAAKRQRRG